MATIHVSGISPSTTNVKLRDFFSFCGKITSLEHNGQEATIHFEKPSAAKTALLLSGGNFDGSTLHVTADNLPHEGEEGVAKHKVEKDIPAAHPDQHDKPRAGIAAEYLAQGYNLADHTIQRMIDFDAKQGISKRFLNYFHSLDSQVGERALGRQQTVSGKLQATVEATVQSATEQAREIDRHSGISKVANDVRKPDDVENISHSHPQYYERALSSPWGLKVKAFYTSTTKQVQDIHEEARRIAEQQKNVKGAGTTNAPKPTTEAVPAPEPTTEVAPVSEPTAEAAPAAV